MSKKNLDRYNRFRGKIVSFRVSNEENEVLHRKVALSGKTKQDYIISSILDKEIVVVGNSFVIRSVKKELKRFIELYGKELSVDDEEVMKWMLKMLMQFDEKKTNAKEENRGPRQ